MREARCSSPAAVLLCWAGCVHADVGPTLPAATPITGTSLCLVPSTEYAPRWDAPGNGSTTLTATDCARACEADPVCTGATYVSGGAELNCWFKDWGQGPVPPPCLPNANSTLEVQSIFDPAGEECSSITYSGNAVYACDDEAQIHDQPTGVASGSASSNNLESGLSFIKYDRFPGRDYIPGAPKSVSIQDIDFGKLVDTITACEEECDAHPICNAVAFLSSPLDIGGKNCYLKVIGETCGVPADIDYWNLATFSIRCEGPLDGSNGNSVVAPVPTAGSISNSPAEESTTSRGFTAPLPTDDGEVSSADDPSTTLSDSSATGSNSTALIVGGCVAAAVLVLISVVLLMTTKCRSYDESPGQTSALASTSNSLPSHKDKDAVGAHSASTNSQIILPFKDPAPLYALYNQAFEEASSQAALGPQHLNIYGTNGTSKGSMQRSTHSIGIGNTAHLAASAALKNYKEKSSVATSEVATATTISIPAADANIRKQSPSEPRTTMSIPAAGKHARKAVSDLATTTSIPSASTNTNRDQEKLEKIPVLATTVSIPDTGKGSQGPSSAQLDATLSFPEAGTHRQLEPVSAEPVSAQVDTVSVSATSYNSSTARQVLEEGKQHSKRARKLMMGLSSEAGAVGQAAPDASVPCVLAAVPTRDSVSNYASEPAAPPVAPDAHSPLQEWKDHLEWQLDSLLGKVVHGSLKVLRGHRNRLHGGQAVVQIVEDTENNTQYAIKFFLSPGAFRQERALYEDKTQPLGRFLPQLKAIAEGEGSGLRDAHGTLMPPCIIMEKGEALDVWIESSGEDIDLFTGLQVLTHIAERLKSLHQAGYVHRDIKPGNIMWLPRTKRWTLIDFGCAAPTGTHAPTGFSLYYAAPEVLAGYVLGDESTKAEEALDAWSLGVLAIELLSGKPAFDHMVPKEQTIQMILGSKPAPWEDPKTKNALLKPLGIFKSAVLGLLAHFPADRCTIHEFQLACRRVLANTTTVKRNTL